MEREISTTYFRMYKLRQAAQEDYTFLYQLHKATMQEYVEATWAWDEEWQRTYFARKFNPNTRQIIKLGDRDVGVISVERSVEAFYIALIEILPAYQRCGLGTCIISELTKTAHSSDLPVILHVLKTNLPARRLYERLGFAIAQDEDVRYKMICQP